MSVTTNVPEKPMLQQLTGDAATDLTSSQFFVGNMVSILFKDHSWYTGMISEIHCDNFYIHPVDNQFRAKVEYKRISLDDVERIRRASKEDLKKSYFDSEEEEFWMTHYIDKYRGVIVERTPKDIELLRKYLED